MASFNILIDGIYCYTGRKGEEKRISYGSSSHISVDEITYIALSRLIATPAIGDRDYNEHGHCVPLEISYHESNITQ